MQPWPGNVSVPLAARLDEPEVPALVGTLEASHGISTARSLCSLAFASIAQPVILVLYEEVCGKLVAPRTVCLLRLARRRIIEHVAIHSLCYLQAYEQSSANSAW